MIKGKYLELGAPREHTCPYIQNQGLVCDSVQNEALETRCAYQNVELAWWHQTAHFQHKHNSSNHLA